MTDTAVVETTSVCPNEPRRCFRTVEYLIILVGMLPIALIYIGKFVFNVPGVFSQRNFERLPNLALQFFWLWLMVAIGCYQMRKPTRKPTIQPQ